MPGFGLTFGRKLGLYRAYSTSKKLKVTYSTTKKLQAIRICDFFFWGGVRGWGQGYSVGQAKSCFVGTSDV